MIEGADDLAGENRRAAQVVDEEGNLARKMRQEEMATVFV